VKNLRHRDLIGSFGFESWGRLERAVVSIKTPNMELNDRTALIAGRVVLLGLDYYDNLQGTRANGSSCGTSKD
jgi:hypothetical protein